MVEVDVVQNEGPEVHRQHEYYISVMPRNRNAEGVNNAAAWAISHDESDSRFGHGHERPSQRREGRKGQSKRQYTGKMKILEGVQAKVAIMINTERNVHCLQAFRLRKDNSVRNVLEGIRIICIDRKCGASIHVQAENGRCVNNILRNGARMIVESERSMCVDIRSAKNHEQGQQRRPLQAPP